MKTDRSDRLRKEAVMVRLCQWCRMDHAGAQAEVAHSLRGATWRLGHISLPSDCERPPLEVEGDLSPLQDAVLSNHCRARAAAVCRLSDPRH